MAVTTQESETNIQSLVQQGVPKDLITGYGNKLNPNEMNRILSSFQANGNPYAASNINGVLTAPTAPPDYNDPLGYRTRLESEVGLTDARTKYNETINSLREFDRGTTAQQNFLEDQTLLQGVITGQKDTALRQRNATRATLTDAAEAEQDFLLAKQQEVETRYGIFNENREIMTNLILNNPGAQIKYTDSIETASSKLDTYAKQVKKDAYKDELKKIAMQMGISTKGKSTKDLEKKISKVNKSALKLAEEESKLRLEGLKMDIANTKSLIAERGKGGGNAVSPTYQNALVQGLGSLSRGETDGFIDPTQYKQWALDALTNARSDAERKLATEYINSAFNFLNPEDAKKMTPGQ